MCTQTAVYWANPVTDGFGGHEFDPPVEIACRWENKTGQYLTRKGEARFSRAEVYVIQDLSEGGYLHLGELKDLKDNPLPTDVSDSHMVQRFDKSKALVGEGFIRKAYL